MRCTQTVKLLGLYVGGDTDTATSKVVANHLATCAECRRIATEYEASQRRLRSLLAAPEPNQSMLDEMREAVMTKITSFDSPSSPRRFAGRLFALFFPVAAWRPRTAAVLAATGLVIAVAVAFSLWHSNESTARREISLPAPRPAAPETASSNKREHNAYATAPERHNITEAPPAVGAAVKRKTHPARRTADAPHTITQIEPLPRMSPAPTPPASEVVASAAASDALADESLAPVASTQTSDFAIQPTQSLEVQDLDATLAESAAAPVQSTPDKLRIELQTSDPNIRIIWFAPKETPATETNNR